MRRDTVIRYSEAFKLQVVEELESGKLAGFKEARARYGIAGNATIQGWVRKYGREHLLTRVVRVERMNERDRVRELEAKVARLEKALGQSHMKEVLYETWLEVACEEFGVTDVEGYKKKLATRS